MALHAVRTNGTDRQPDRRKHLADLTPDARALLNHLRLMSLRCRVSARTDLFEAYTILSVTSDTARTAHAETLMKCIGEALGRTPVLFRPGIDEISFDEAWLMRAATCAAHHDWDSFDFLLRSRVPDRSRRTLAALIVGVSERFGAI